MFEATEELKESSDPFGDNRGGVEHGKDGDPEPEGGLVDRVIDEVAHALYEAYRASKARDTSAVVLVREEAWIALLGHLQLDRTVGDIRLELKKLYPGVPRIKPLIQGAFLIFIMLHPATNIASQESRERIASALDVRDPAVWASSVRIGRRLAGNEASAALVEKRLLRQRNQWLARHLEVPYGRRSRCAS